MQLKQLVDKSIFKRGKDYYDVGNVSELNIQFEKSEIFKNSDMMTIESMVYSKDNFNEYEVNLAWNPETSQLVGYCTCPFYQNNRGEKGPCKHMVATLFKYMYEYQDNIGIEGKKTEADYLIEEIKSLSKHKDEYKREINLTIKYDNGGYGNRPCVELKVGNQRQYVVKSMKKFLDSIKEEQILEFGKQFCYDPSIYKFSKADEKIIDMLIEIRELEDETNANRYNYYSSYGNSFISGKKIFLTDKQIYRILELAKERTIDVIIDGIEYSNVEIKEKNLPLKFNMAMKNNKIEIEQMDDIPKVLDSYLRVFWYENVIYLPSKEQIALYSPLFSRLINKQNNKMIFSKDEGEKVVSNILPLLKNVGEKVSIDKSIKDVFYEAPLIVKTYLDKEDSIVTAKIKLCYDNIEIDPLKGETAKLEEGILIRDIVKEENGMKILESFGFEKEKDIYTMNNEKNIVTFIKEGVNKLQQIGEVYYSESFKNIKVYGKNNLKGGIKLNEDNLLEFSFELEGVKREELKDIFNAIREKKKYFRLKNGDFVSLEDDGVKDLYSIVDYIGISDSDLLDDNMIISKYNALYIDNKIKDLNMDYIERSKNFRELTNNIKDSKEMDYDIPTELEKTMRNYQITGFKWLKTLAYYGFGGILADEMGLGKTIQTIALLTSEIGEAPSLVVVPTSLVYNWKSEIEVFSKSLKVLVVSGSKKEREELIKDIEGKDVVITSYPLIRRDIEAYKDVKFNYCILDEAQKIKNPNSQSAFSVKEINANGYFALTGTPIENSLTELWSIFDFIMPGYLSNHSKFIKTYENPIIGNKDKNALEELNRHIKPFILRRLKKDVIKELPPKIEKKLLIEMTDEQKTLYSSYLDSAKKEIDREISDKGFNKSKIKILSILTRLRQICCDPTVFIEDYSYESGKMLALDDLLEETLNEGHRVLLFSQFTSVLKNIRKRLDKNEITYMYLDGNTKSEARHEMVMDFNKGETSVFLISLKAGGTGLNLTGADVVIHFDPWWNPAVEDQATDRAHRIGQEKTVEVIKLLAQGTIEEKIFNLQQKKKEMIKSVIDDNMGNENVISKMTQNELEDLFV